MKVIVAGLPKTGTKSMQAALIQLGYNDYDFIENFAYLKSDWMKIFKYGGSTEDYHRMFENVDAVTDLPGCYFWDEIHKAFPDAKIILTMRENEEVWFKSFEKQIQSQKNFFSLFGIYLSPTLAKLAYYGNLLARVTFGPCMYFPWFRPMNPVLNKSLACMIYRRHNSHVLHTAPRDKLLVYNVKEGWEPLCRFLDVDIPDKPFPHKNIKGELVDEYIKTLPMIQKAKKELIVSISLLSLLAGFGVYKFVRGNDFTFFNEPLKWLNQYLSIN